MRPSRLCPTKQIVRQTGHSRKSVRQVIRGDRSDIFRTRQSSLDQQLPWFDDWWASGCRRVRALVRRRSPPSRSRVYVAS